ncbi:MAG: hypothetical protein HEP70_12875 [Rhodobiaceae bacterium]|nr:hypothetical protein [Rhodobiaceae bacterium]
MTKFSIVFGTILVLVEIGVVAYTGGPAFWPMWAKNILAGGFLLCTGFSLLWIRTIFVEKFLVAAWGFASGLFLVSTLGLMQSDRPLPIVIGLAIYTLVSFAGLIATFGRPLPRHLLFSGDGRAFDEDTH